MFTNKKMQQNTPSAAIKNVLATEDVIASNETLLTSAIAKHVQIVGGEYNNPYQLTVLQEVIDAFHTGRLWHLTVQRHLGTHHDAALLQQAGCIHDVLPTFAVTTSKGELYMLYVAPSLRHTGLAFTFIDALQRVVPNFTLTQDYLQQRGLD
jgi:GNAT superfamily N-acetyltransferase